jgi:methylthioribose-1-phosphate isomerase
MSLEAIRYEGGKLTILDQLQLPYTSVYIEINTLQDAWDAINKMKVPQSSTNGLNTFPNVSCDRAISS